MSRLAVTVLLGVACTGCGSHAAERRDIALTFRDPASVIFDDFHVSGDTACGRVNAKNGYGGYVGARPFVAYGLTSGTPFVDYGPDDTMSADDLRERLESDREACVYATKRDRSDMKYGFEPTAPSNQCSWQKRDIAQYNTGRKYAETLANCLKS